MLRALDFIAPCGLGGAWGLVTFALGIHVIDEALTGFLDFYNPLVRSMRTRVRWFPMPTFEFNEWLAGLSIAVAVLAALTPFIQRRGRWSRAAAGILSGVMLFNGLGHLAGSIYFGWWLPGTTSAPLLYASLLLAMRAVREAGHDTTPPGTLP